MLASAGVVLAVVVVTGGSAFGFPGFPVWLATLASVRPTLGRGLLALAATPALTALAAGVASRGAVVGSVAENLAEGQRAW